MNARMPPMLQNRNQYLIVCFIPKDHRAYSFLNAQEVRCQCEMALVTSIIVKMRCVMPSLSQDEMLRKAFSDMKTAVGSGYFWVKNTSITGKD